MSLEENKAVGQRIYDAFNRRNIDALDDLLAPNFVDHTTGLGIESIKQVWSQLFSVYPAIRAMLEDAIAEGDKVATRVTFQGVPATTKQNTEWMLEIARIADGKVVELWGMIKLT